MRIGDESQNPQPTANVTEAVFLVTQSRTPLLYSGVVYSDSSGVCVLSKESRGRSGSRVRSSDRHRQGNGAVVHISFWMDGIVLLFRYTLGQQRIRSHGVCIYSVDAVEPETFIEA